MFGVVRWVVLLKISLAGLGMMIGLQAAATQEVLKPADGEGTPSDRVRITWVMNSGSSTSQVCLANTCNLSIGRFMRLPLPSTAACKCFEQDSEEVTERPRKSAEIPYADLAVGARQPDRIAWTVVAFQPTSENGKFKIISHVGSGTSYRMLTPVNLKLVEYGERMGLTWDSVPNADAYLVEACCSAEGSRATELVRGDAFSMPLPEALRAGCETPARGVKAAVRACRNGGCGDAATLDVCSPRNFSVRKAEGQGARDFVFRWSPVGGADSYLLEICCDAAGQTEKRLIGKGTHADDNMFELLSNGMPYVMTVENRFDTVGCTLGLGSIANGTGFKASLRPCTNGVCGESQSARFCRPALPVQPGLPGA